MTGLVTGYWLVSGPGKQQVADGLRSGLDPSDDKIRDSSVILVLRHKSRAGIEGPRRFRNHGEGLYYGLLLVEIIYQDTMLNRRLNMINGHKNLDTVA